MTTRVFVLVALGLDALAYPSFMTGLAFGGAVVWAALWPGWGGRDDAEA